MAHDSRSDGFANSLTDLMAGVAAIFLLIAVIFILIVARRAKYEERERQRFESQIRELEDFKEKVLSQLEKLAVAIGDDDDLRQLVEVDPDAARGDRSLLVVVFDRERLKFPSEHCELSDVQVELVRRAAPRIFEHVCQFAKGLESKKGQVGRARISITLEGHTDRKSFLPTRVGCGVDNIRCGRDRERPECKEIGFENNVRLSAARAQNVFFEMRRAVAGDDELNDCLERHFVIAGRGPVEPASPRGTRTEKHWREPRSEEEDEQNRRVVLKIRVHSSFDKLPMQAPSAVAEQ